MKEGRENQQVSIFERTCTTCGGDGIPKKWRIKDGSEAPTITATTATTTKSSQKKRNTMKEW